MKYDRTYDGKPLSVSVSGFTQYSTERLDPNTNPIPVVSPQDILNKLEALQKFLNVPELEKAITRLYQHIHKEGNPHNTQLEDFQDDISDVLYNAYVENGGTESKDAFLVGLFSTIRVATLEDMANGAEASLLINTRGANEFMTKHEEDKDAHLEVLKDQFPGTVIEVDPVFSINSLVGMTSNITEIDDDEKAQSNQPFRGYSFIGHDGFIHYESDDSSIPVDYSTGRAAFPCFGTRTNQFRYSEAIDGFTTKNGVRLSSDIECLNPSKSYTANKVIVNADGELEHNVSVDDVFVEANKPMTFSVFAKPLDAKYLIISYKDMYEGTTVVYGVFNFEYGTAEIINDLNRYRVNIVELANDWYRCEFTMSHPIGQIHDVNMTLMTDFDMENPSLAERLYLNKELGYLWGIQLEVGSNASPYIPTTGKATTRLGVYPKLTLTKENWYRVGNYTLQLVYRNPGTSLVESSLRPVFTLVNNAGQVTANASYLANGNLELNDYNFVTDSDTQIVLNQEIFNVNDTKFEQLVHGISTNSVVTKYNTNNSTSTEVTNLPADDLGYIYLGCDPNGNFLDGYLCAATIYPKLLTVDEATYANGEEIYGN